MPSLCGEKRSACILNCHLTATISLCLISVGPTIGTSISLYFSVSHPPPPEKLRAPSILIMQGSGAIRHKDNHLGYSFSWRIFFSYSVLSLPFCGNGNNFLFSLSLEASFSYSLSKCGTAVFFSVFCCNTESLLTHKVGFC